MNDLGLSLEDLKAFVSDGASVMTVHENGVAAKFRALESCGNMITIHCICHRLTLGCGNMGNKLKFVSDFELALIQLWRFFKNPPK